MQCPRTLHGQPDERGPANRYRDPGIGAPLSAKVEPLQESSANKWIPASAKIPITAFVRFDNPREGMSLGKIRGKLELHDPDNDPAVRVGSHCVPLESDSTAALALATLKFLSWICFLASLLKASITLDQPTNAGVVTVVLSFATAPLTS